VLLPATQGEHAQQLADRVRVTVEQRLELHDYRSEEQVPVTVSVGVLIAESVDQSVRAEQLMIAAKDAVDRAKEGGRNRVETVDASVAQSARPPRDTMPMD
jgi:GGDEF domain-containing protein